MLRFLLFLAACPLAAPLALAAPRVAFPVPESLLQHKTVEGQRFRYLASGPEAAPPILLIHGFGASAYHWRYQIPHLAAQGYRVLAVDLLGFGSSAKPVIDYSAALWTQQCAALLEAEAPGRRAMVAGNSLGGYVALCLAAERPDLICGCTLLNVAGRFADDAADVSAEAEAKVAEVAVAPTPWAQAWRGMQDGVQKFVLKTSFYYTKTPQRIEQVLRQVYVDSTNVDAELIESIRSPADDADAAEVFYRIVSRTATGPLDYKDTLTGRLRKLEVPLFLLWGQQDPWIRPVVADKIQALRPDAKRLNLAAGHCPHDEVPDQVNDALVDFMLELGAKPKPTAA